MENTIEKIKSLSDSDEVRVNAEYKYVSDEWGMNRSLSITGDLISVAELKLIVEELEHLKYIQEN